MNGKIIILIASLATCVAIESGMLAAAVPMQSQKEPLTASQQRAAGKLAEAIMFNDIIRFDTIFNDNFREGFILYDNPVTALTLAININDAVQTAVKQFDGSLAKLQNSAGRRFQQIINEYINELITVQQATAPQKPHKLSPFEELSAHAQAEIVKYLSDTDLAHLAKTSSHEMKVLTEEMGRRTTFYWRKPLKKLILQGHSAQINALAYSPNGAWLVSGSDDKSVIAWDIKNNKEKQRMRGHTDEVTSVAISADNKNVTSGSSDNTVRLWNLESGNELKQFSVYKFSPVTFSHDSKLLAFVRDRHTMTIYNIKTMQELAKQMHGLLVPIVFSDDDKVLAALNMTFNCKIFLWDRENNILKEKEIRIPGGVGINFLKEDGPAVAAIAPLINLCATTLGNTAFGLFSVETGAMIGNLLKHEMAIYALTFSADGTVIASGDKKGVVKIWNVATRKEIATFDLNTYITALAFSFDGKTLAIGCQDGTIQLVSTKNQ